MKKKKKRISLYDADHPYRQAAINVIERVIEPILQRGLDGERYYDTEDAIVETLRRGKLTKKNIELCAMAIMEKVITPLLVHGIRMQEYKEAVQNIERVIRSCCFKSRASMPPRYNDEDEPDGDTEGEFPFEDNEDEEYETDEDDNGWR